MVVVVVLGEAQEERIRVHPNNTLHLPSQLTRPCVHMIPREQLAVWQLPPQGFVIHS